MVELENVVDVIVFVETAAPRFVIVGSVVEPALIVALKVVLVNDTPIDPSLSVPVVVTYQAHSVDLASMIVLMMHGRAIDPVAYVVYVAVKVVVALVVMLSTELLVRVTVMVLVPLVVVVLERKVLARVATAVVCPLEVDVDVTVVEL